MTINLRYGGTIQISKNHGRTLWITECEGGLMLFKPSQHARKVVKKDLYEMLCWLHENEFI